MFLSTAELAAERPGAVNPKEVRGSIVCDQLQEPAQKLASTAKRLIGLSSLPETLLL
jgi:hypothetical protein